MGEGYKGMPQKTLEAILDALKRNQVKLVIDVIQKILEYKMAIDTAIRILKGRRKL